MLPVRKIILHSPVSDEALLKGFVEQCLDQGVTLIAIYGPGAEELEDAIDWLVIEDSKAPKRFLCTTSHVDEPYDEVLNMVRMWESDLDQGMQEVHL